MGMEQPEPDTTNTDDAAATLEELEWDTFEEVILADRSHRPRTSSSPKKCCKIGKRVAEKGLYCNIDLMQVSCC